MCAYLISMDEALAGLQVMTETYEQQVQTLISQVCIYSSSPSIPFHITFISLSLSLSLPL
jgi:hypothetical protein